MEYLYMAAILEWSSIFLINVHIQKLNKNLKQLVGILFILKNVGAKITNRRAFMAEKSILTNYRGTN